MAGKGKYYESQFEEATIELLRESSRIGNIRSAMTFTGNIPTRLLKKTCGHFLPLSTRTND